MNDKQFNNNERIRYSGESLESSRVSNGVILSFVVKILLLIVIGFPIIQFLFNGNANTVNLQSLMQILQSAPTIDMSWFSKLTTGGIPGLNEPWELFDGFRVFFSYISEGVLFFAWLVTGVVNCITFISYFVMQMMTM